MYTFLKLWLSLLFLFVVSSLFADQLTPEKEKEINTYLESDNDNADVIDLAQENFKLRLANFKKEIEEYGSYPDRYYEIMQEEFEIMFNALMTEIINDADRKLFNYLHNNFTYEEIKQFNEFYSKGVGKKFREHDSEIAKFALNLSYEIAQKHAPETYEKIEKRAKVEGIEFKVK